MFDVLSAFTDALRMLIVIVEKYHLGILKYPGRNRL